MDCVGCHAKCCTKLIKYITIHDAVTISQTLHLDPLEFVDLRPAEDNISSYPTIMVQNKAHILTLDSKNGTESCVFLLEVGISNKCGIHSIRPMGCKTYPYSNAGEELHLLTPFLCHKQYWPEGRERQQYVQNMAIAKKEMEEYAIIVQDWNQQYGDKGNTMQFLHYAMECLPQ